jgi:protein phosphatase
MGGHRAGSEASKLAIHYFAKAILNNLHWLERNDSSSETDFTDELKRMLVDAHDAIQERSSSNQELQGMGTTLTMAYVSWPRMIVVHAGDTRCYLIRNSELRLITRDHTVANQMMQAGRLSPDSVERSPWSNVLINALGGGAEDVFADVYTIDLMLGDSLLMCSDGLNKHVTDTEIQKLVASFSKHDIHRACEELILQANAGGGSDNTTVIMARFSESQETGRRMKLVAANPTEERIIQDIAAPYSDSDTTPVEIPVSTEDSKDTADFPGPEQSTGEFH